MIFSATTAKLVLLTVVSVRIWHVNQIWHANLTFTIHFLIWTGKHCRLSLPSGRVCCCVCCILN